MKKLAFLLVLVVAFALVGGAALAAETPHGPFDANSAVCAACHRAHTASAEYLLATPRVTGLCIGCHDGSGADTNVLGGLYVVDGSEAPTPGGYNHGTWGAAASPLMGGGFTQILAATNTTSAHMTPGTGDAQTLFDVQFGMGAAPGVAKSYLDCVDCHMPHRSTNYRMLRVKPTGYAGANLSVTQAAAINSTPAGADAAAEIAAYAVDPGRQYTEDKGMFNYAITNASTAGAGDGVSKWCGLGCHEFYYRSAVRSNNGAGGVGTASPQMQVRVTTSIPAATVTATVAVSSTTAITGGSTYVWIKAARYLVMSKTASSITLGANLDTTTDTLAGTPVSIEGAGMEVYYDLDATAGADPTFMHAIDVDLNYTPRNGSSANQTLGANLGAGTYADKMPVADMNADAAYDDADMMTCLTCHRAHGTAASMSNEAAIPARTISGIAFPSGTNSMLLRLDNRTVCQQCHNMPSGF